MKLIRFYVFRWTAGIILLIVAAATSFFACSKGARTSAPNETGAPPAQPNSTAPPPQSVLDEASRGTGAPKLWLTREREGDRLSITLSATSVSDLYQIGGTLAYDSSALKFLAMTPDGNWGAPEDRIEFATETSLGLDFALSKKYIGPGLSGAVRLAEFKFEVLDPAGDISIGWFEPPIVRDRKKRDLEIIAGGEI
ncbi:MAG: hypothetical protein HRF49_09240 [bacterium]